MPVDTGDLFVGGATAVGDEVEGMSGFVKENGTGLGWVVAPSVEGKGADEDGVLSPIPFPKMVGVVDDEAAVEVDDGTCGGFTSENGEREVVVGAVGALGKRVEGMEVEVVVVGDSEKPGVAAAAVPLIASLVLGGVANKKVEVLILLCAARSSDCPSATTVGAGVSVIVGTAGGLEPNSRVVTLAGISTDFWGGA